MANKVAPDKSYSVEVYFNEMLGRWFAKFSASKYDVQYEFPLRDTYTMQGSGTTGSFECSRPSLSWDEESILALVFSQMVATVRAAHARQRMAEQIQNNLAPGPAPGATEAELIQ